MFCRRSHAACLLLAVASTTFGAGYIHARPPDKGIEQLLKKRIDINFENTPLKDVLDEFSDFSGINIVPDKPALDEAGVSMESPISMQLERVSLRSALNLILHQVKLTYIIKDDVLQITSHERAYPYRKVLTYPVADLLKGSMTEASLIDLITRSIAPQSWSSSGGKATIEYRKATLSLKISQTIDYHEQIQDLLASLRRLQDQKITPPAGR